MTDTWNYEGEYRVATLWLRFERIRIERGRIVFDIEFLQPIEIIKHEPCAESDSVPLLQIAIDLCCMPFEMLEGRRLLKFVKTP